MFMLVSTKKWTCECTGEAQKQKSANRLRPRFRPLGYGHACVAEAAWQQRAACVACGEVRRQSSLHDTLCNSRDLTEAAKPRQSNIHLAAI